jgi:hypothetical protein
MHVKGIKPANFNALLIFQVWNRKMLLRCVRLLVRFQSCPTIVEASHACNGSQLPRLQESKCKCSHGSGTFLSPSPTYKPSHPQTLKKPGPPPFHIPPPTKTFKLLFFQHVTVTCLLQVRALVRAWGQQGKQTASHSRIRLIYMTHCTHDQVGSSQWAAMLR